MFPLPSSRHRHTQAKPSHVELGGGMSDQGYFQTGTTQASADSEGGETPRPSTVALSSSITGRSCASDTTWDASPALVPGGLEPPGTGAGTGTTFPGAGGNTAFASPPAPAALFPSEHWADLPLVCLTLARQNQRNPRTNVRDSRHRAKLTMTTTRALEGMPASACPWLSRSCSTAPSMAGRITASAAMHNTGGFYVHLQRRDADHCIEGLK
jgi:hypothetical protein